MVSRVSCRVSLAYGTLAQVDDFYVLLQAVAFCIKLGPWHFILNLSKLQISIPCPAFGP